MIFTVFRGFGKNRCSGSHADGTGDWNLGTNFLATFIIMAEPIPAHINTSMIKTA